MSNVTENTLVTQLVTNITESSVTSSIESKNLTTTNVTTEAEVITELTTELTTDVEILSNTTTQNDLSNVTEVTLRMLVPTTESQLPEETINDDGLDSDIIHNGEGNTTVTTDGDAVVFQRKYAQEVAEHSEVSIAQPYYPLCLLLHECFFFLCFFFTI